MNRGSIRIYKKNIENIGAAVYYSSPVIVRRDPTIENKNSDNTWSNFKNEAKKLIGAGQGKYPETIFNKVGKTLFDGGQGAIDFRFLEYGLEYNYSDKIGILKNFNSYDSPLLFPNNTEGAIPSEDLDAFVKSVVPSNYGSQPTTDLPDLFGTFTYRSQKIFVFPVPEKITKIALFENKHDSRISQRDPDWTGDCADIVISIGLNDEFKYSEGNKVYYFGESRLASYFNGSMIDTTNTWAESEYNKHVFLSINTQSQEESIDISYQAWLRLDNPLRNKKTSELEKIELDSVPSQTSERIPGIVFDELSGSILGTKEVQNHPILDRKLREIDKTKFSQWKRYSSGDKAWFGVDSSGEKIWWESLCDNNYGNLPKISPKWELSRSLTEYYTKWFFLRSDNGVFKTEFGEAENIIKLNIPEYTNESFVMFYPSPGYTIDTSAPVQQEISNMTIDSGGGINLHITENTTASGDRYYMIKVTWDSWESIKQGTRVYIKTAPMESVVWIKFPMPIRKSSSVWEFDNYKDGAASLNYRACDTSGNAYKFGSTMNGLILSRNSSPYEPKEEFTERPILLSMNSIMSSDSWTIDQWWTELFPSLNFKATYEKRLGNKTWTGTLDNLYVNRSNGTIRFLNNVVDFEEATFTIIPEFDYYSVTIENTGNFAVLNRVFGVLNGKKYYTEIFPYKDSIELPDIVKVRIGNQSLSLQKKYSGGRNTWSGTSSGTSVNIYESWSSSASGYSQYSGKRYVIEINPVKSNIYLDIIE